MITVSLTTFPLEWCSLSQMPNDDVYIMLFNWTEDSSQKVISTHTNTQLLLCQVCVLSKLPYYCGFSPFPPTIQIHALHTKSVTTITIGDL